MYPPVLCSLLYIQFALEYITPTLELLQNMKYEAKHTFLNMTFSLIFILRVFFFKTCWVYLAVTHNISTCNIMYIMSNKNLGNVRFFIQPSRILSDIQKPVTKGPGGRHEWRYSGFFIECVCDQWLHIVGCIVFHLGCGIQYRILCIKRKHATQM